MPPPIPYAYQVGQALAWTIFRSVGARIEGKENIPASGSVLLVSNHQSYLDPLFVSMGCPRRQVHFMAKEELFDFPTSRHMMLGLGAFPVNRNGPGKATLVEVLKLLRDQRCLCLFAEGTRSKDGRLREFQPGFAKIARKTKTSVVPIAITGTRQLFEGIQGVSLPIWSKLIGHPAPVMRIGRPVSWELSAEEIAAQTQSSVRRLLEE
ncbi:MAG: 1-acyl-sn-glycerol-3-phosphate acyltransferase [Candidatus Eremiobacteraeota bacterium]|nr:1-acyl-sn-glycerol-3-phosphate acyltransferase [Candidatus Eremiobacteraeota bacterium]